MRTLLSSTLLLTSFAFGLPAHAQFMIGPMPCPKITGLTFAIPQGGQSLYAGEMATANLQGENLQGRQDFNWKISVTPAAESTLPAPADINASGGPIYPISTAVAGKVTVTASFPGTVMAGVSCPGMLKTATVDILPVKVTSLTMTPDSPIVKSTVVDMKAERSPEARGSITYKWSRRRGIGPWENLNTDRSTYNFCASSLGRFEYRVEGMSGGVPSVAQKSFSVRMRPLRLLDFNYVDHWETQDPAPIWARVHLEIESPPLNVPVCDDTVSIYLMVQRNDSVEPFANAAEFNAIAEFTFSLAVKEAGDDLWSYRLRRVQPDSIYGEAGTSYQTMQEWREAYVEADVADRENLKSVSYRLVMPLGEEARRTPLAYEIYADLPENQAFNFPEPAIWELGTFIRIRGGVAWAFDGVYKSMNITEPNYRQAANLRTATPYVPARQRDLQLNP